MNQENNIPADATNKLTQAFIYSQILDIKTKRNFSDELMTVSHVVKNVINMFLRTKPENQPHFLESYIEYRYM